ncbi:MAG: SDR family oxidoreductase [Chromatiales bacterium]|jgi:NAD(P)-dependent dehydrogenase (short-subunit alcohol dehydrogenase family)|nr:SDR family oxidoreductase [Chromatiales bacterium]
MNVVITGANRGVGLGLLRHYLAAGHQAWACVRSDSKELARLKSDSLHLVRWDVREAAPSGGAPLPERVDLLINNAGIWSADGGETAQGLEDVTDRTMQEVFDVDCIGPLRVVQHLLPALLKARGVIVNVSSQMGSSADNTSGGSYAYRAAKAALVITTKSMAIDLAPRGVRAIAVHPGWVRTDMGGPDARIDVDTSVAGLVKVFEAVSSYPLGAFVAYDGTQIPF